MPSGPSLTTLAALVAAQEATREYLNQQAVGIAQQAATDFTAWYAADAVAEWSAELAENIAAVTGNLAGLTSAYLSVAVGELAQGVGKGLARWVRPSGTVNTTDLRGGDVTHAQAYGRAASAYRFQQSKLDDRTIAMATEPGILKLPKLITPRDAAVSRAVAVAKRDVQLTVARQSQKSLQSAADQGLITGWRRMVHPELSKTGTCGLCIAASTRIYKTSELMPIHDNCNCLPMPVTEHHDPGLQLDRDGFARIYGDAGNTSREALKKTRYQITDNGELGPVLAPAGAKQRTPVTVARQTTEDRLSPAEKDAHLRELRDSLQRSLPRLDQQAADDPTGRWASYRDTVTDRIQQLNAA